MRQKSVPQDVSETSIQVSKPKAMELKRKPSEEQILSETKVEFTSKAIETTEEVLQPLPEEAVVRPVVKPDVEEKVSIEEFVDIKVIPKDAPEISASDVSETSIQVSKPKAIKLKRKPSEEQILSETKVEFTSKAIETTEEVLQPLPEEAVVRPVVKPDIEEKVSVEEFVDIKVIPKDVPEISSTDVSETSIQVSKPKAIKLKRKPSEEQILSETKVEFTSKAIETTEEVLQPLPEEAVVRPVVKPDIEEKVSVEEFVDIKVIPKDAPEISPKDVSETSIQVSKPKAIKLKRKPSEEQILIETKVEFTSKAIETTEEVLQPLPEEAVVRPVVKPDVEEKVSIEEFVDIKVIPKDAPEISASDVSETSIQVSKPKAIKLKRKPSEEQILTETKVEFTSKAIETTEEVLQPLPEEAVVRPVVKPDVEEKVSVEEFVDIKVIPKDVPEISPKDVSETSIQVSKPKAIKLKRKPSEEQILTETKVEFTSKAIETTEEVLQPLPEEAVVRPVIKPDVEEKVSVEEFVDIKVIPKDAPEISATDVSETSIQVSKPKAIKLKRKPSEEQILTETKVEFTSKAIETTEEVLQPLPEEAVVRPVVKPDIEEKVSVEEFVDIKVIPKDAPEISTKDVSETSIQVSKPKAMKLKRKPSEEQILSETKVEFTSKAIETTEEVLQPLPEEAVVRPVVKPDIEEKVSVEEFVDIKVIPKDAPEISSTRCFRDIDSSFETKGNKIEEKAIRRTNTE